MANPPVTIGPFTNVPAPGSPIRSDWAQSVSTYINTEITTRHGCSLTLTNQSIGTGVAGDLLWTTEVYDSDAYHAANVAPIVIPAGKAGVYNFSLAVDANGTLNGASNCQIVAGAASPHVFYIPSGNRYGAAQATFECAVGASIKAVVYNGHSAAVNWTCRLSVARISL